MPSTLAAATAILLVLLVLVAVAPATVGWSVGGVIVGATMSVLGSVGGDRE